MLRTALVKKRILVIDDEPAIRELLSEYFVRRGCDVSAVATGREGLAAASETPCDLILVDVVLPDADGMEILQQLKARHPKVPVIVMTGIGFDEPLVTEATQKGASGYISKTLPLDKLWAEVESALRSS